MFAYFVYYEHLLYYSFWFRIVVEKNKKCWRLFNTKKLVWHGLNNTNCKNKMIFMKLHRKKCYFLLYLHSEYRGIQWLID